MIIRKTASKIDILAMEVMQIQLGTEQDIHGGFQKHNHMKALSALFHSLLSFLVFSLLPSSTVNYNCSDLIQVHLMTDQ